MGKCKHGHKHKDCKKCCEKIKININEICPGYSELKATSDIAQRFYLFLDSASTAKNYGRNTDQSVTNAALATLGSIMYPQFEYFAFITVGTIISADTVAGIQGLYQIYANYIFNAFSMHYAQNVRVTLEPNTCPRRAIMTGVGGEHASIIASLTADFPPGPGNPVITAEQETYSNWCIEWIEICDVWYINIYLEYGDRIFRNFPGTTVSQGLVPSGGQVLFFQRLFPNAYLETTVPPGQNAEAATPPGVNIPCMPPSAMVAELKKYANDPKKTIKVTGNTKEWGAKIVEFHKRVPCKP